MSNLFETFAEDYPTVTFIKVDVDKCDEILYEMTLKALPTVIGMGFLTLKNMHQ